MKRTLIIHPSDPSTSFLDVVYESIPNKTVITGGVTKDDVRKLIEEHDRVMMMGHGSPDGLFAVGKFINPNLNYRWGLTYIIDNTMVPLLLEKDNSVFIWCNADRFVDGFGLKGFYTKMFISEVAEARFCGLPGTSQDIVDESNYGFVNILSECINEPQEVMFKRILEGYGKLTENNSVALYNHNRLCFNKP